MTDVLRIALDRRNKLHDEIKKLDEFIRMAEALVRAEGPGSVSPAPITSAAPAMQPSMPASVATSDTGVEESPMRAAARKLSDAEVRRTPDADAGTDAQRPSIIRRGLAG